MRSTGSADASLGRSSIATKVSPSFSAGRAGVSSAAAAGTAGCSATLFLGLRPRFFAFGASEAVSSAGAAATAKSEAIADAEGKYQTKGDYEVAGTAETKIAELKLSETYEAKGAAATVKSEAIAQAKADATEALKGYYTKGEVDNLLSTNSTGDRAYAKQYTDELFGSFQFAANSDIDALFAAKAE